MKRWRAVLALLGLVGFPLSCVLTLAFAPYSFAGSWRLHYIGDVMWSPDGEQVAFISDEGVTYSLYRVRADGSDLSRLVEDDAMLRVAGWSEDGQTIFYQPGLTDVPYRGVTLDGDILTEVNPDSIIPATEISGERRAQVVCLESNLNNSDSGARYYIGGGGVCTDATLQLWEGEDLQATITRAMLMSPGQRYLAALSWVTLAGMFITPLLTFPYFIHLRQYGFIVLVMLGYVACGILYGISLSLASTQP